MTTRDELADALEAHAAKHGSEPHYAPALREAAVMLRADCALIREAADLLSTANHGGVMAFTYFQHDQVRDLCARLTEAAS